MDTTAANRERLLRLLATATFVIFFQAYMVAPIIPQLGIYFGASDEVAGSVVPAYLIPYGIATLVYGVIADRVGIRLVMLFSLSMFILLSLLTLSAQSIDAMIIWRFLTGLGASGVVPMALVLVGMQFPYEMRGRPLGWLFGAMAGGMAFGSSIGAVLEPFIGWRGLFMIVGASGAVVLVLLLRSGKSLVMTKPVASTSLGNLVMAYRTLLTTSRGARTYGYVFVNSIFHSGVFTWLGVYFEQRYHLDAVGVGLALLGYGVPGFLFGPFIGRMADRYGRGRILPIGLLISALAGYSLTWNYPLIITAFAVMFLSLGYDMTQPLLGGIVTTLGGQRPGQAMGLNVFMLFVGFGVGSLLFGRVLTMGFGQALTLFAIVEGVLTLASLKLFHSERPKTVIGLP